MVEPDPLNPAEVVADDALVDVIGTADAQTLAALQEGDWHLACLLAAWVASVR